MRNVLAKVTKGNNHMVAAAIRTIFAQPTGLLVREQVETIAVMLDSRPPCPPWPRCCVRSRRRSLRAPIFPSSIGARFCRQTPSSA